MGEQSQLNDKYSFQNEVLEEEFFEYIPTYFSNRWKDYQDFCNALNDQDLETISSICHRILGSAQSYGLFLLDELISDLQTSAKSNQYDNVKMLIDCFHHYLKSSNLK